MGGIGSIYEYTYRDIANYSINSIKDLNKLINHFEKYPLLSQKAADFLLFKKVVNLMANKAHFVIEGLNQIINIKASMNLGLSDKLKSEFKEFTPVERPRINAENIINPFWIAGFVSGEGNFDVRTPKSTNKTTRYRIQLRFRITQHERDLKLMENLVKYIGSGVIYKYPKQPAISLIIVKFSDITDTIIPLFNKYPLVGVKKYDFIDWCKIHSLMSEGSHLTPKGNDLIIKIRSTMNKGRY